MNPPDLTQNSPRSPRVWLGSHSILTRVLNKARATIAISRENISTAIRWIVAGIGPIAGQMKICAGN